MKKVILIFIFMSLFLTPAIFSQAPSEYYYVNVVIDRIYPYSLGYIVVFQTSGFQVERAYIPREWFNTGPAGRGEMLTLRAGREWPSMTIFYNRGEFSHVRLRVRDRSHPTWGLVPPGINLDQHFQNIEDLRIQF